MKISKLFFLFLFLNLYSFGQKVYNVKDNFESLDIRDYIEVLQTLDDLNTNEITQKSALNWEENKVSYGFSKNLFWLRFTVKNTTEALENLYLEVNNPHLRFIEFYELIENKLVLKYKCGRHMPFDTRPVDNVGFIFPIDLNSEEHKSFYVKVDKRNSSLSFPVKLWNKNKFTKTYNRKTILNGIFFGGVLLAIVYSLVAFFNFKRRLYIFYCLYVLSVGLYMFTSAGYSFQYIAKNSILFNSFFRVITLVLTIFFQAKFVQSLLKSKENLPKLHRFITYAANSLILLTVFWIVYSQFSQGFLSLFLNLLYILIIILVVSFLVLSFSVYHKMKRIVKLYVFSFTFIILAGILMVIFEYGWFPVFASYISPLYLGSFVEIVILSIVLISEMRSIMSERENLSLKVVQKQQEVVQAYIDGIEKEKLRISEELHDDIGSKLSSLNQFVSAKGSFSDKTRTKIETIINDVRSISHKLSPNKINFFSFNEQIENVVQETLHNSTIQYKLFLDDDFSYLGTSQKLNIYRIIQETVNNALKYSKATSLEVQLNKIEKDLILTIADNGIGFNTSKVKKGLGLFNINNRVDYLKGKLEISSVVNKGTNILVVVPLT